MYVESVPNRSSPPAVLLRESYRDRGRVKKRTLANLSKLPAAAVEAVRRVLRGERLVAPEEAFTCVRSLPHGHIAAVLGVLKQLELDTLIARGGSRVRDLVMALIAARVIDAQSKLATARALTPESAVSSLGEALGLGDVDQHELYAAMDWLVQRQAGIEQRLAKRHLQEHTLVLYDLTSSYVEGTHCPLAQRGHSRDGKKGTLQIVFGLLCTAEGCPVAVEVFEGSTSDPKTVASQVAKLRERFGLERVVLVGDRGMLTAARIREDLQGVDGLRWITTLRAPTIRKLVNAGTVTPSLFDERDLGVCAAENGATIAGEIGRRKDLMSTTFRRYAPDQSLLLPPDVRAWLPEGHLAHPVSDLVDGLDLTAFYAAYAGDGRRNAPYAPRMMVKVLLYAYATGVFSSRGIARRLEEDVAFRVLAAGNFPQHRTVCEFRRRHLEDFKALFVEVVRLARELGLARFGKLSIDGTKVRANASKHKAMSYGRMQEEERRLAGEIDALVRAARDADAAEDERFGPDARGDELPSELRRREDRLAAIRAAKERLEAAQRAADDAGGRQPGQARNPKGGRPYKRGYGEPDEKAQSNFTDPESGIMKTSNDGFQQCYNAQVAVDGEHQLVVATEVTANASDQGGLPLLLDEVAETVGEQPDTVLADAGYSKDTDGNYLAVCRAPEAAENGLRLDALGNLISITVLTSGTW